jgi:hypothetical protein
MAHLLSTIFPLLGVAALPAIVLLAMLVLRNPFSPNWLKGEGVAQGIGLALTAGFCVAVGVASDALVAASIHYLLAFVLIIAVLVLSTYGLWTLFAVGKRLKCADEGLSPFARERQPVGAPAPAV